MGDVDDPRPEDPQLRHVMKDTLAAAITTSADVLPLFTYFSGGIRSRRGMHLAEESFVTR